jgi:putative redox protein
MSVHVESESAGAARQVIRIDAHTLHADLPAASGGGSAPDAHDYFDASLAVCKALTAIVYARARNMALDRVEAHVERDDSKERQGTYVLKVKMAFFGGLSDEEKQKLNDVLTRCPVHKLMTSTTVDIQTAPLEG